MRTYKRYRASVKVRLGICTCIYVSNHGLAFICVYMYMFYHVYPCDVSWRVILSEPGSIDILLRDYVLLAFYSIYLYVYRVSTSYVLDVHSHVWHMGLARPQVVNKILLTNLLTYLLTKMSNNNNNNNNNNDNKEKKLTYLSYMKSLFAV